MKIFITGGSGLLGSALSFELIKKRLISGYHSSRIIIKDNNFSSVSIDITNIDSFKVIEKMSPDVIIHTAALTDLEFCEKNPELAYEVNVKGTENVISVAEKCSAKLVYICTDYIFDGENKNYSELDKPNPLSVYAKTKLQGEEIIKNTFDDFINIRTSLYGWPSNPKKSSFSSWIINSLRNDIGITLVDDQMSSLMFTNDFANILLKMLEYDLVGTYNVASTNSMSKYDFSLIIAEIFNLNKGLICPISLNQYLKKFHLHAKRPKNVSLNTSKIARELGQEMPTILEGIVSMKKKEEEFKKGIRWIEWK